MGSPFATEGLDDLHLGAKERAQLEAMGIATLEQLSQCSREDLGIGKGKGDALIARARNILAVRHVKSVSVRDDHVTIEVDLPSRGVVASVKGVLGAYDDPSWGNCTLEVTGTSLLFQPLPASYVDAGKRVLCGEEPCNEPAAGVCLCHGHSYCQKHSLGHQMSPASKHPFDQVVEGARTLAERLEQRREKELADRGVTLPEQEVRTFARGRGFTGFWQSVFEEIQQQDVMKQALAAGLFSTPREPVHVLVIGEPASAKSLARDILLRSFSDLAPIGGNATRAGLVCDRSTGALGALSFSDGKTVLVDEFDKIDPGDLGHCLELLSNGRCDVHSARVHEAIESRFVMLAFANPEGDLFSGDLRLDIGMRPTVMSRFALVVKVGAVRGDELVSLLRRSLERKGEFARLPQRYNQWLKLARLYQPEWRTSPQAAERYVQAIRGIIERYISTPLRRDIRMKDYLRRVPEAMARSEFSPVEDRHIHEALGLFEATLATWSGGPT